MHGSMRALLACHGGVLEKCHGGVLEKCPSGQAGRDARLFPDGTLI
jgi:hypothetical protein